MWSEKWCGCQHELPIQFELKDMLKKLFSRKNFHQIQLKSKNARWLSSLLCKADFSHPHLRQSVAFSWTHFRFIMWAVRCFITSTNNSIVIFQANAMENTFNGEHFLFKWKVLIKTWNNLVWYLIREGWTPSLHLWFYSKRNQSLAWSR